jgi:argininosuccinate synthase
VQQLEVHAVTIQTGGFSSQELAAIEARARELGASTFEVIDVTQTYYDQCIKYLIYGNVLKNSTYPLSVSAERMVQAIAVASYAQKVGADYVAHGSTGAGNDQVRFDMVFQSMLPGTPIITPIRDMKLSREAEIQFLKEHGVQFDAAKAQYSINKGLWGTSVGGKETLTSHGYLPETAWPTPVSESEPKAVELAFERGELIAIDGNSFEHPVKAIQYLQQLAQPYGIGRDIHVGDTIIGIKGRVGFEAAAPLIIIKAHHLLEKHTLTKWQLYWKDQLSTWYGKVFVTLLPYRFLLNGVESSHDLMSGAFGTYGEVNNSWTGDDVKGFAKIFGNQVGIFHSVNKAKTETDHA